MDIVPSPQGESKMKAPLCCNEFNHYLYSSDSLLISVQVNMSSRDEHSQGARRTGYSLCCDANFPTSENAGARSVRDSTELLAFLP